MITAMRNENAQKIARILSARIMDGTLAER